MILIFISSLASLAAALAASGKLCTTPWSVIATAGCPHLAAVLTMVSTSFSPSIALIFV